MKSTFLLIFWTLSSSVFLTAANDDDGIQRALENLLLLRDPAKGVIKEKEIKRLALPESETSFALRHLSQFSERVPLDGSRHYWIDRFHRDLYRALLSRRGGTKNNDFNAVDTKWSIKMGHQSQVFMRPDGLPLPNNTSSPYLEADLLLLLKARELPSYGSLQLEFFGHRRDFERTSLSNYDIQTMGLALSFLRAVDQLKLEVEQSFFGSSASRPGSLEIGVTWEKEREIQSAFLNGSLTSAIEIQHQTFMDLMSFDQLGQRKDTSRIGFELIFEALPFHAFGGKSHVSFGGTLHRHISKSSPMDKLGFEPSLEIHWIESSGTYEFNSHLSHFVSLGQEDALGDRDDQLLLWRGQLRRNMSERWALDGGWEFQLLDSKQSRFGQDNETLYLGLDCRL